MEYITISTRLTKEEKNPIDTYCKENDIKIA
jgi:hypothetical protein